MLFGASTSGPAVTIQRFTPQEFVAVCTYDVTIVCPGMEYSEARFKEDVTSEWVPLNNLHTTHDIPVSGYSENVSSLSQELFIGLGGVIFNKTNCPNIVYTIDAANSSINFDDDFIPLVFIIIYIINKF